MKNTIKPSSIIEFLSIALFLLAIHPESNGQRALAIPNGKVIEIVQCINSPEQSYAAYIPTYYHEEKEWPVIYFFEPMARGKLPIGKYEKIAEQKGFILIGSNNSKNGPIIEGQIAFEAMIEDTQQRLNIDPNQIYVSGFSGGGRFAQLLTNDNPSIRGVIAVAGPRLDPNDEIRGNYLYFGIVGTRDMNYIEHLEFKNLLDEHKLKNVLLTYVGPHQWPPTQEFESAISWFQIQHRLDETSPDDVDKYINLELMKMEGKKNLAPSEKYTYLEAIKRSILPIENHDLNKRINTYLANKDLTKTLNRLKKSNEKEVESYEEISKALQQLKVSAYNENIPLDSTGYSLSWWQTKIKGLQKASKKEGEKADAAARTLDVIRGQVFGVILKNDASNNLNHQLLLGEIQLMLYPEAVSLLWSQSVLYAKVNNRNKSLHYLKKAKASDLDGLNNLRAKSSTYTQQFSYLFND
ncbi:hypothetical protein [Reichenbachiella sp.]